MDNNNNPTPTTPEPTNPQPITSTPEPASPEPPKQNKSNLKIILIVLGILVLIALIPVIFAVAMFFISATGSPTPSAENDEAAIRAELKKNFPNLSIDQNDEFPVKCTTFKSNSGQEYTLYGVEKGDCANAGAFIVNYYDF